MALAALLLGPCGAAMAQSSPSGQLPPGVILPAEIPAQSSIPPEVIIGAIDVDWTDPELRVEMEIHGADGGGAGKWSEVAGGDARALKIQLAGFEGGERRGALEAPAGMPSATGRQDEPSSTGWMHEAQGAGRRFPSSDRVIAGGIAPWTYAGPSTRDWPGWDGGLGDGGSWVGVHWLGTVESWLNSPPKFRFTERLLLSTLNPLTGQGSFLIVQNRAGGHVDLERLTPWIENALSEHHLLAVHSRGADAYVEQGSWQLLPVDRDAGAKPAGAVLVLRPRGPGDPVDFAREPGVQIEASSHEFAYPAEQVLSGRLWPVPQRPSVWMSRTDERRADEAAWIQLGLDRPRLVDTIRLVHAAGSGWSEDFLPGSVILHISGDETFASPERVVLHPESAVSTLRFSRPKAVRAIRIEFAEPGARDLLAPARLMGLQVWGREAATTGGPTFP